MTDSDASDDEVYDVAGQWMTDGFRREEIPPEAERMSEPVRCAFCSGVYDLHRVTVTGHYADCSLWRTPCCDKLADDREWKSRPDFRRLGRPERNRRRR